MSAADRYLEYLGGFVMPTATTPSASFSFAPRDILLIEFYVAGLGTTFDDLSIQFNGDVGANYASTYQRMIETASNTFVNPFSTSATSGTIYGNTNTTNGCVSACWISNLVDQNKNGVFTGFDQIAEVTGTQPVAAFGAFNWFNTTSQITSIVLLSGSGNIAAGTGYRVYGCNLAN